MKHILFIVLICLALKFKSQPLQTISLQSNWTVKIISGPEQSKKLINKKLQAEVPSTLHLVLQDNKEIPDPFFEDNIKQLEWVSSCNIQYELEFTVDSKSMQYSQAKIIFEGIDTYAEIYLNGILLGNTKNSFLKYEYLVKSVLKIGQNSLLVKILSTKLFDAQNQRKDRMPFEYAHTRKACYQYSWDWAPYMNTLGIWQPVSLVFYSDVKIDYVWARNKQVTHSKAVINFVVAIDQEDNFNIESQGYQGIIKQKSSESASIFQLTNRYMQADVTITDPVLWWPNGIGKPHLYEFEVAILKDNIKLHNKTIFFGIRTVSLNQQGTKFEIIINGHPVYCKGANYVPPDMMYPRLTNLKYQPKNTIENLLSDAVASNYNMLRVWGGGQYESDQFYLQASRKGIMIFHDFMFSDSIYPSSGDFLANVKKQIIYQVRRIRNYPCLALWSGNNQILQGIYAWGWGSQAYRQNYKKLFGELISEILKIESPDISYIESSPSKGVGNGGFERGGDIHYWGVWAAGSPFASYETALGGFNSQFGTQSLPVWQTIKQFTSPAERNYESTSMLNHQRHNSRFRTLIQYMTMYAKKSLNFQLQVYQSGLVQAYGIQIAIRSQRIAKPKSMGTLYWQMNDAWPAVSWSSIDYYGRWKPLQYKAKNLYADIILFYNPKGNDVIAVNDKLIPIDAYYIAQVITFDGHVLFSEEGPITLAANERKQVAKVGIDVIRGKEKQIVVYTQIIYGRFEQNRTVVTTYHQPLKNLELDDSTLNVKYLFSSNEIILSAVYLIKSLHISSSQKYIKLSDNYFDVVPGHPVRVKLLDNQSLETLKNTMTYKAYRQVYDPSPLKISFE